MWSVVLLCLLLPYPACIRYKVRPAWLVGGDSGRKFAMRGQNAPHWAISSEQGEFCTGDAVDGGVQGEFCPAHAVGKGLLGEFCTGCGVGGGVQGEFCIGSGVGGGVLGEFFCGTAAGWAAVGEPFCGRIAEGPHGERVYVRSQSLRLPLVTRGHISHAIPLKVFQVMKLSR